MTWTDARVAQLTRLWAAGVSASGIAAALGDVSRSAVLGKLHRLKQLKSRASASPPRRYDGPLPDGGRTAGAGRIAALGPSEPPAPPAAPWREAAFAPLPGTAPRPWLSRDAGECAFPAGGEGTETLSCCAPVQARSAYCAAHHAVVFRTLSPSARASEQRRWAEAVERWAA
jgi:GcrA cell cycle regulator